ncbi:putative RNA-directed DNA polymerase from transposon BS [Stylophora pistillata]|uniref:Putative RNA-directed DNA polymerase from transposon BS n=1 Tax=Stylophora pistillata TaxID=50429 RepID=A0A2B4R782_STYPI|nr:putative RNA-directed DNA polymerase from transposon BS [Stylophora pistillata]
MSRPQSTRVFDVFNKKKKMAACRVKTVRLIPEQIYLLLDTVLDILKKEQCIEERIILDTTEADISQPEDPEVDKDPIYVEKKKQALTAVRKVLSNILPDLDCTVCCKKTVTIANLYFLDSNSIIHHSQSGNRRHHSTETALLHYTDELLKSMDDKKISVIVLLDMSKAFDSIRHDLLINKLHKLGVSFATCSWFLSYVSQLTQVVKIENSLSEPLPLKAGVPQGSILGPMLFTLYVNDLLQVPKHCRALRYVDDTKVFMALPSSQLLEAVAAVNQDLRDISSWCCAHSLLINPDKTN